MILLICVDNNMGLSFGGKRQSRDSALCDRILALSKHTRLHMTPYSRPLFSDDADIKVSEKPESVAGVGEYYFVEDGDIPQAGVERIHLFCWNRSYPATRHLPPINDAMCPVKRIDFVGFSHKKITEQIFEPKK